MPFAGIDIGSTMTKVVIADEEGSMLASHVGPTGVEHRHLALQVMDETIRRAGLAFAGVELVVATGYGRINVPFADRQITEITCHARGIRALFPAAKLIIEIGGQDCKGIRLNAQGKVADFVMNDKCAAGTGRFLEVIAETLDIDLGQMGEIALAADGFVQISNTCTVFAEHEVTSRLAEGVDVGQIAAGLHQAIAGRVVNMTRRLGIAKEVVVTGGGAKNRGLVKAIEQQVGFPVLTPPEPLITGALGAALAARDLFGRGFRPQRPRRREDVTFFA